MSIKQPEMKDANWKDLQVGQTIQVWLCEGYYDKYFWDATAEVTAIRDGFAPVLKFANGASVAPGIRMDRWVVTQACKLATALNCPVVQRRDF